MIKKEDVLRIFEEVKENFKRLDACETPHDFTPYKVENRENRYLCKKCNGYVEDSMHRWYTRGLEDGRKERP